MKRGAIQIHGPLLAKLRGELALSQRELGERVGVTETRIRHIERKEVAGVYGVTFRKLAEATSMTLEALKVKIGAASGNGGNGAKPVVTSTDEWDKNFDPYSMHSVPEIPFFEATLAAGHWVPVDEFGEVCNPQTMDAGLFRVRLRGDSMKPAYQDGDIVEFKCLGIGRDAMIEGRDYYVQHVDGTATFKRLEKIEEEVLTLRPLNKKKYPKAMPIERTNVVKMALAVYKLQMLGL